MSKETIEWLNENTMLGNINDKQKWAANGWGLFDDATQTFKAWWDNGGFQNGYPGPIPVEEVERVLFNWSPVEAPIFLRVPCSEADSDGMDGTGQHFLWVPDQEHKAIMHPNTHHVFNYFGTDSYKVHEYNEWLVKGPATLVDSELGINSAGLLRQGGQAYVNLSLPEEVTTASGFSHRTSIMASTSIDGSLATKFQIVELIALCDNSMSMASDGARATFKVKHSSRSIGKLQTARDALGLIYKNSEEFDKFIDGLASIDVTDRQFADIVNNLVVIPEPEGLKGIGGKPANQRAITIAERKQGELYNLYTKDPRAAKWNGTLLGVYQAANTWNEHFRSNNENGVERLMAGTLNGTFAKMDQEFWTIIAQMDGIAADMVKVMA